MEEKTPQPGDGATIIGWTDRTAATIIAVSKNGKQVTVQDDEATLLNGANSGEPDALEVYPGGFACHTTGRQRWGLKPDPDGRTHRFSKRKSGRWVRVGDKDTGSGSRLDVTRHSHYYDFNF